MSMFTTEIEAPLSSLLMFSYFEGRDCSSVGLKCKGMLTNNVEEVIALRVIGVIGRRSDRLENAFGFESEEFVCED